MRSLARGRLQPAASCRASAAPARSGAPAAQADVARRPRGAAAHPRAAQLSPDGTPARLPAEPTPTGKPGRLICHLWRQDVAGGAPVQLTFSDGGDPARCAPLVARRQDAALPARRPDLRCSPADGGEPRVAHARHADRRQLRRRGRPTARAVYFLAADPPTADERERDAAARRCVRARRGLQAAPSLEDRRRRPAPRRR